MKIDNVLKYDTGEVEGYYTIGHVDKEEFWQELILKLGTQTVIELTLLAIARASFKLEECLNTNVLYEYWIKKDDGDLTSYCSDEVVQVEADHPNSVPITFIWYR
ncbi:hypothetical protein [Nostoc sp. TCL26-01]|uniref:hypothetical protein n=1 Tax=Nostoc sp. TCL26-01 TaxID=2576904 RepID=UPI0015BD1CA4|nr:hypothetical protein [Nostoc sp. TCL26-01]QLE60041.1 hypothetical protein FD725_32060 [Nostoc sp. TCL26-01]